MKAGDLIPGLYYAHGSDEPNCEILAVRRRDHEVEVDYVYQRERVVKWYSLVTEWAVTHHSIVISEEPEWVEMLA